MGLVGEGQQEHEVIKESSQISGFGDQMIVETVIRIQEQTSGGKSHQFSPEHKFLVSKGVS